MRQPAERPVSRAACRPAARSASKKRRELRAWRGPARESASNPGRCRSSRRDPADRWPGSTRRSCMRGCVSTSAAARMLHLRVRTQQVEVVDVIAEAILVAKHLRRRADQEVKRAATLVGVAARLHADLGDRFRDRLGILQTGFVLYFQDHGARFRVSGFRDRGAVPYPQRDRHLLTRLSVEGVLFLHGSRHLGAAFQDTRPRRCAGRSGGSGRVPRTSDR